MSRTQITGEQISDNSLTSADIADSLDLNELNLSGSLNVAGVTMFDADELVMTGTFSLNGTLVVNGQVQIGLTRMTGSISLGEGDSFIAIDGPPSGSTLNLGSGSPGRFLIIKDVGGTTQANPVKVLGQVDGNNETWINSNYGSMMLCWTGSKWSIL